MKKIFMCVILALFLISSAFSVRVELDQVESFQQYSTVDKGNRLLPNIIVGNTNTVLSVINATQNFTYDFQLEIGEAYEPFFYIIDSGVDNKSIQLMWYGDLTRDPSLYIQNITLNEYGQYYFRVEPSYESEPITIMVNLIDDTYIVQSYYVEEKPKGFNALMTPLVEGFGEVIGFFINFWAVAFYTVIFVLSAGFILTIFGLAFLVFSYAKKLMNADKSKEERED